MKKALAITVAALAAFACGAAADDASLELQASTPTITLNVRTGDRRPIRLPKLEYVFRIETRCARGGLPQSLLISVADTRKRIPAAEFVATEELSVSMTIPSRQIAPLMVDDFCLAGEQMEYHDSDTIIVRGTLSVQAALRCLSGDEEQVTWASHSLDVKIECVDEQSPGDTARAANVSHEYRLLTRDADAEIPSSAATHSAHAAR